MEDKYRLELTALTSKNTETIRIYNEVENACERLNAYAMDFFQTVEILKERIIQGKSNEDEVDFVLNKIDEVNTAMSEISNTMPELVKLIKYD